MKADWVEALSLVLNVIQALGLAYIADRSRRRRAEDRRWTDDEE